MARYIPDFTVYYTCTLQVHGLSLKSAGERVRIILKELETLTYSRINSDDLLQLHADLKQLKLVFQSKLPHLEGIVIRPAVVTHALKIKRKYAHITAKQHLKHCSTLPEAKSRKKNKSNSHYRNRVGIRAERLRKVSVLRLKCYYTHELIYCPL